MNKSFNDLSVEVYSSGTTRIPGVAGMFRTGSGLAFSTIYPGGLYADAQIYVPGRFLREWALKGARRVIIRNGQSVAYEGYISNLSDNISDIGYGKDIDLIGGWGQIMINQGIQKRWADNRYNENLWVWITAASLSKSCFVDRQNNLLFTPKAEAVVANDRAGCIYTMPTGETIVEVDFDYNLTTSSAAADWSLILRDPVTLGAIWSVARSTAGTSSSTGITQSLSTPRQSVQWIFQSDASQTPASDGSVFAQVTNLVVRSETGSIDLTEIATDFLGYLTDLNSSTAEIDSNTYSLIPFVADDWSSAADVLIYAASFGDASFNNWAVGLYSSEHYSIASKNGKPTLFVEQYPVTTDYDYDVSYDDENLVSDVVVFKDYDAIYNWIPVKYYDENGYEQWITPDDDSNLKDTTSIAAYGTRILPGGLDVDAYDSTMATNAGRRFLAANKDPKYRLESPIVLKGYIKKKSHDPLPTSLGAAGKRVRLSSHPDAPVFLITHTRYDADSETISMNAGDPPGLIYPPSPAAVAPPPPTTSTAGGGGGSTQAPWTTWSKRKLYVRFGRAMGYTWAAWQRMTRARLIQLVKAYKRSRHSS